MQRLIYVVSHGQKKDSLKTYHKTDNILSQSRLCLAGWEWSGCRCQTTSRRRHRGSTRFSHRATCVGGPGGCERARRNKEKSDQSEWWPYMCRKPHSSPHVFRMATLYFNALTLIHANDNFAAVPVVKAGSYGHGVEGHGQAQVANSQVDDKVLGRFEEVLLLVGDIEQRAVPKHRTHPWKSRTYLKLRRMQDSQNRPGAWRPVSFKLRMKAMTSAPPNLCVNWFGKWRFIHQNALTFCDV